jgi:membrane protease YdiL (CAAX protease family)
MKSAQRGARTIKDFTQQEGPPVNKPVLTAQDCIKRNPIIAFSLLSISICYGTLFPAIYLLPHTGDLGSILGFYCGRIGVYSPVMAGMIVTRILHPGHHQVSFVRRLKVSLPVWGIAAFISAANLRLTAPPSVPMTGLIILSLPVALLPAWVVSSALFGSPGIRSMLVTLIKPRGKILYIIIALLTFPVTHVVGSALTNRFAGKAWIPEIQTPGDLLLTLVLTFFFVVLFAGGMNEESGWRGFAQKRLQANFSPLVSALLLWVLMVIWHIPNDLVQYQSGGYVMIRLVLYFFITVLFCWLFNRTQGSILPVVIFHASMNTMNPLMGILPITPAGNVLLLLFAGVVIIVDRMWRKLPVDHPAVVKDGKWSELVEP